MHAVRRSQRHPKNNTPYWNPFILLSTLKSTLNIISAIPRCPSHQRHLKPIILPWKPIHFALHTKVHFKYHLCDSALSIAPTNIWETYHFAKEITHFAMHTEVHFEYHFCDPASQSHPKTPETCILPEKPIHFALHTEIQFKYHFCGSALFVAPEDTWKLEFCTGAA